MPFVNGLLRKKGLGALVNYCYLRFGLETTVQMLDGVKTLGFLYATKAGISIGIDDLVVPQSKASPGERLRKRKSSKLKSSTRKAPSPTASATTR